MPRRFLPLMTLAVVVVCSMLPSAASAGTFQVDCGLSHSLADDPIVRPNQPGAAHMHNFYGATSASASSTWATMVAAPSTCTDAFDTAGYWQPQLKVAAAEVRGTLRAYYSRGNKPTVRPYPRDLRVVAGKAHSEGLQSREVVYWRCVGRGSTAQLRRVPQCARGEQLSSSIIFPDCWNGRDLDSADHSAHMAYSVRGTCPGTHSVALPRLVMQIVWPVRPAPATVTLSSGGAHTMHADFWNTWRQLRLRRLTNRCLNQDVNCGLVRLAR